MLKLELQSEYFATFLEQLCRSFPTGNGSKFNGKADGLQVNIG